MGRNGSLRATLRDWLRLAFSGPVVRRALLFAVVVGIILAAINHGDTIVRGEIGPMHILKIGLTAIVPYAVSALSSVAALRTAAHDWERD